MKGKVLNVFCLSTGRCGSTTFAKSLSHLTNFTSGHETRINIIGPKRFDYPDNHIESDNRLSWMLGSLDSRFGDHAVYVHLWRNRSEVAASYSKRYHPSWISGIMHGFGHGILMRNEHYSEQEIFEVANMYVDVVESNIKQFLKDKSKVVEFSMHKPRQGIDDLWKLAGLEGDRDIAYQEWTIKYNASID